MKSKINFVKIQAKLTYYCNIYVPIFFHKIHANKLTTTAADHWAKKYISTFEDGTGRRRVRDGIKYTYPGYSLIQRKLRFFFSKKLHSPYRKKARTGGIVGLTV